MSTIIRIIVTGAFELHRDVHPAVCDAGSAQRANVCLNAFVHRDSFYARVACVRHRVHAKAPRGLPGSCERRVEQVLVLVVLSLG